MSRHHAALNRSRWRRIRRQVLDAAGWRCARCGRYGHECHHIQPLDRGGSPYDPENLECICRFCHIQLTREQNRRQLTEEQQKWRELLEELARDGAVRRAAT